MRNITYQTRKLRNRNSRKLKKFLLRKSEYPQGEGNDKQNLLFREGWDRVTAIGVEPKYLSSHARKTCGYTEDEWELRRIAYNKALNQKQVDAAKAKMGDKATMQVRARA